jgi:hypothetical protein
MVKTNHRKTLVLVHLLVLETFAGRRPLGMQACHNDGNSHNNALQNLRWDTPSANHLDKIRHGTIARGERNGFAKLSSDDVAAIRLALASGIGPTELARRYGLSRKHVQSIKRREVWAHVA